MKRIVNSKLAKKISLFWQTYQKKKYFHASVAGICLIYLLAWLALAQNVKTQQETLTQKRNLLALMQKIDTSLKKSGAGPGQNNRQRSPARHNTLALTASVQAEFAHTALTTHILQLRQGENGTIQLNLKQANFDLLTETLQNLAEKTALTVKDANLTRSEPEGTVSGTLILSEAAR